MHILKEALAEYLRNFKAALPFALLLIFVLPFFYVSSVFISSGSIFLDYNFVRANPAELLLLLFSLLLFLFFFSVFLTLIIFGVRKSFSSMKLHYYLTEKISKFSWKIFLFLLAYTVIAAIVTAVLVNLGMPVELLNVVWLIAGTFFLFFPQIIVVEENSLSTSLAHNFEFVSKNLKSVAIVLAAGFAMIFLLALFEFIIDYIALVGKFVSLIVCLVFVVPYLESLKTILYMHRFDLIKSSYEVHKLGK